jgi:hypothetical protein
LDRLENGEFLAALRKFRSPMGWGSAGKDQNTAAMNGKVLNFNAALRAVK